MAEQDNFKKMQDGLTTLRENEIREATQYHKDQLTQQKAISDAEALDELLKGRTIKNSNGHDVLKWDEAMNRADAATNAEAMAYNDWRAAITGLLTMYSFLNKAIEQSMKETVYSPASKLLHDKALFPLSNMIREKLTGNPEIDLPTLHHCVHFTDNKLVIDPLTRSDRGNDTGALDALFKVGVHEWLEENGYNPDPANEDQFLDNNGAVLTQDMFDNLQNDPDKSLHRFLSQGSKLSFTPRGPGTP